MPSPYDDTAHLHNILACSPGLARVAERRLAQIYDHGRDADHDDTHDGGEIMSAAAAFLHVARTGNLNHVPPAWPWNDREWRPPTSVRDALANAGAMIVAEIDRLTRAQRAADEPLIATIARALNDSLEGTWTDQGTNAVARRLLELLRADGLVIHPRDLKQAS